ncbi:hypothetical protein L596_012229 [Steinernema carpocapsae]|uniref:BAR domain-containing protein n=1 Tax=Steinernema carpocapsae TaxID=34508 RepID=A0A4U5NX27_STECR|nr:hypothetical protein L596_012229 [Steinernema carpocapsae]
MFRRLKQNIKEKTGRATTTKFTPEQDQAIAFSDQSKKCVEDIAKAVDNMGARWKGGGMTATEEIGDPASVISGKLPKEKYGIVMRSIFDTQTEVGRMERRMQETLHTTYAEGVFKLWLKTENAKARQIVSTLKQRRLDKDACNSAFTSKATPERQAQMEQADKNFEEAVSTADSEFANFPSYQQNHAKAIKQMAEALAKHYGECADVTGKHLGKAK